MQWKQGAFVGTLLFEWCPELMGDMFWYQKEHRFDLNRMWILINELWVHLGLHVAVENQLITRLFDLFLSRYPAQLMLAITQRLRWLSRLLTWIGWSTFDCKYAANIKNLVFRSLCEWTLWLWFVLNEKTGCFMAASINWIRYILCTETIIIYFRQF